MPRDDDNEPESEADRRRFNLFLLAFFVVIVGIGVWLVNAMIDARKADECIALGRRNCAPIELPAR